MYKIILPAVLCFACSLAACKKDKHQSKPFVTTAAGNGIRGFVDGPARYAQFTGPSQIAFDAQGNLYVADPYNQRVRKITTAGMVSTLAGNGTIGYVNGPGAVAQFNYPHGIAIDAQGNLYVSDYDNNRIRKISPSGDVSLFAGTGVAGSMDGPGASAQFNGPVFLAIDANGNVYVADQRNNKIRKITPAGIVSTLAGSGTYGTNDGTGTAAQFQGPTGIACDAQGNVYVGDMIGNRVRKITPAGVVSTLAGSSEGFAEGRGADAKFRGPAGLACDTHGNAYVADELNHRIRKITPDGVVTTYAGSTAGFLDGEGSTAQFNAPDAVAIYQEEMYVSDFNNWSIRKIVLQ